MVLIRKRYFRKHLQNRRDAERFRTRLARRVLRLARPKNSSELEPKIKVEADPNEEPLSKLDPSKGIGQALAATMAGVGVGIGVGETAEQMSPTQHDVNATLVNPAQTQEGLGLKFMDEDHLEVQSPTSISIRDTSSMDIPVIGNDSRTANPNILTSSPHSGVLALPQSPTSLMSASIRILALPQYPTRQLRQRQGA